MEFVAINKPKGITSHDVVDRVRRITGIRKVGHAGTLDPNATGVLVIAIGRQATKQISKIVMQKKEYVATIRLDQISNTDDSEGEVKPVEVVIIPDQELIKATLGEFKGIVMQVPPVFSAIKMAGVPAYKRVRRGEQVVMEPREVEIHYLKIYKYEWPYLTLRIGTGKGVYIRSIARDLGRKLETGGLLEELVRTKVGEYTLEQSLTLVDFEIAWKKTNKDQSEEI